MPVTFLNLDFSSGEFLDVVKRSGTQLNWVQKDSNIDRELFHLHLRQRS